MAIQKSYKSSEFVNSSDDDDERDGDDASDQIHEPIASEDESESDYVAQDDGTTEVDEGPTSSEIDLEAEAPPAAPSEDEYDLVSDGYPARDESPGPEDSLNRDSDNEQAENDPGFQGLASDDDDAPPDDDAAVTYDTEPTSSGEEDASSDRELAGSGPEDNSAGAQDDDEDVPTEEEEDGVEQDDRIDEEDQKQNFQFVDTEDGELESDDELPIAQPKPPKTVSESNFALPQEQQQITANSLPDQRWKIDQLIEPVEKKRSACVQMGFNYRDKPQRDVYLELREDVKEIFGQSPMIFDYTLGWDHIRSRVKRRAQVLKVCALLSSVSF